MSKELEAFELPEDYRFVCEIKGCKNKIDFDTNTIIEKILSTRTKQVDEEIIKQLKNIGEEKGINELILIDESKVLKMIKSVKAFEIIKEKRVDITTLMDCLNVEEYNRWVPIRSHYSYRPFELTQEEFDMLKEVLL